MSNREQELEKTLGMMVDCAIKSNNGNTKRGENFKCIYCQAKGPTPPALRHYDGCLVVRARRALVRPLE